MPIAFKSKHSPDILMLEAQALELIRMMGCSGEVPSALDGAELASALEQLQAALAANADAPLRADRGDEDDAASSSAGISATRRAGPLLAMLTRAVEKNDYLLWER